MNQKITKLAVFDPKYNGHADRLLALTGDGSDWMQIIRHTADIENTEQDEIDLDNLAMPILQKIAKANKTLTKLTMTDLSDQYDIYRSIPKSKLIDLKVKRVNDLNDFPLDQQKTIVHVLQLRLMRILQQELLNDLDALGEKVDQFVKLNKDDNHQQDKDYELTCTKFFINAYKQNACQRLNQLINVALFQEEPQDWSKLDRDGIMRSHNDFLIETIWQNKRLNANQLAYLDLRNFKDKSNKSVSQKAEILTKTLTGLVDWL